jgi:rubredoxin
MNPIDGSPIDYSYTDKDEILDDVTVECPQCGAFQDEADCFLGQLGRLTHYRCRFCGWGFSEAKS